MQVQFLGVVPLTLVSGGPAALGVAGDVIVFIHLFVILSVIIEHAVQALVKIIK